MAGLLAVAALLGAFGGPALAQTEVPADWSLRPDDLAGDQFRLLFLSSTKRDGSSTAIADYNTFVQERAAAGHADIRAYSTGFRAVGCTATVDARDNTSTTGTGVPIYWLNGAKAADNYADFYDGNWDDEVNDKNESGTNGPDTSQINNRPFTGCDHDGTEAYGGGAISQALGTTDRSGLSRVGRPNFPGDNGPIGSNFTAATSETRPMYGLSAVFQVPDTTAPTVTIGGVPATSSAPFTATFTFSEPVTGFVVADITLGNATASTFTGSDGDTAYTALITPTADGAVTVDVAADVAADAAGNGNTAAARASSTYTAPGICRRTEAVRNAILTEISSVSDCALVTPAHLAAITGNLFLANGSVTALAPGDFTGLTSLTELYLFGNDLTMLPAGVFDGLTSLTTLHLGNNDLTTLPAGMFDGLTALTTLRLGSNALTTLPDGVFDGLTSLTLLALHRNALTTLPAGVFDELTSLTSLDLSTNQLTTLPAGVFDGLTSLTLLTLPVNQLTTLPAGVFDGLTSLTSLTLQMNALTTLPAGVFDGLTSLTTLNLGESRLTTLPAGVFDELTSLTTLHLYGNALTTLPAGVFDELTSLTSLSLTTNQLTTLPAGVFDELTSLTSLNLSTNQLTTLPAGVFDELTSLTLLRLAGNPGAPFAPAAVALPDDGTVSSAGGTVTLDGSGNGGPWGANVTYSWALTAPSSGVTVTFDDDASATPVVTIPALAAGTELTFTLTVTGRFGTDGVAPGTDTARVTVKPPDTTAPTVASIERQAPSSSPTNADVLTWRVTFSEAVANVDAADFTVSGTTATPTAAAVQGSSTQYDVTATGGDLDSLNATMTLTFANNQNIADLADNALTNTTPTGTNDNTFAVDNTAPTVAITGVPATSTAAFTATLTFSEGVEGFAVGDIAVGNGAASAFTGTDGATVYTAQIAPTADGTVTVDVAAGAARDAAGNDNTAAERASSTYTAPGICGRTEVVRNAILALISGVNDCALVTDEHLAAINVHLNLYSSSISAVAAGDFAGLTSLTQLSLGGNALTTLPAGVFAGLTSLTFLDLEQNDLTTLPAGVFAGLTSLPKLELSNQSLAALAAGVFDGLTSLTRLLLINNDLTTLPAGVFAGLTSLTELRLEGNDLTTLPAGVFDGLTSLPELNLSNQSLTTLPAGVFAGLTSLTRLKLNDNALTTLPAGVFAGLISLEELWLNHNMLTTLPDDVFEPLTSLTTLLLSDNTGARFAPAAVALPDNGTVPVAGGTVTLDGSGSGGAWGANVTYSWALTAPTSGVTVTFDDAMSATPTVTIPALTAGAELTFTLTVTGRGGTSGIAPGTDTARVTVPDNTAPTVTSIARQTPASSPTNADALTWRVTFSEAVANVDAADFAVTGTTATVTAVTAVSSVTGGWDVTASGGDLADLDATVTLAFANNQNIADLADNALTNTAPTGANENAFVVDNTAPTVTITGVPDMSSAAFTATITFTEPVTGFVLADITLTNATASNFTGADGDTAFTALITPSANGAVTVDVAAGVAADAAGNGNTAAARASSTYDPNASICGRTEAMQTAILAKISGVSACANVTSSHLAAITGTLSLDRMSITALAAGDFDGLTSLTTLFLNTNSLATLPAGVFDEMTSLTVLDLGGNDLSSLPAGVFDEMTSLTVLDLGGNDLISLPAGVFDALTSLLSLDLGDNDLSSLPAGVFDALTSLLSLSLFNNDLATLPTGVFDGLTSLTGLGLYGNVLSSLPARVFDGLTALTLLSLRDNDLSTLPAGVFDALTSLTELFLAGNDLATLRAGVFDGLTSLRWLNLENNELATLPAGVFADLTSLLRLELSGNPGAPFSPTAVALPDDGTVSNDGGTVDLDGSGSDGGPWGANVTYSWALTNPSSGVTVSFDNSRLDSPAVTVPPLAGGTELTFTLTVTGRGSTHELSTGAALATDTARVTATATDTIAPTVTSILRQTPASSPTNADVLTWRVTFSEDVANVEGADFEVSGTSATLAAAAVSGSSAQYDVTASGGDLGSLDATVTLAFDADQDIADAAGNALANTTPTGANEASYVVDNTAPGVASILRQSPPSSPTHADILSWRVTFSEGVANVDTADFEVSGTSATLAAAAVSGSSRAYAVTASGGDLGSLDATVTLAFANNQNIADLAGNALATTTPAGANENAFVVDNTAPGVEISGVPETSTAAFTATITFSEGVNGFAVEDIAVGNGTASAFTGSDGDTEFTALITPAADGAVTVDVAADAAADAAGNGNTAAARVSSTYDPNAGICGRTEAVRNAILAKISEVSDCVLVTDEHLAAITEMNVTVTALAAGDFAGLTALSSLDLDNNQMTTLPAGVFDGLTALRTLDLHGNALATLPAGVFDGLTALTDLFLFGNMLTTLPAGVFDALTALETLNLSGNNALATLPAGVFVRLTALETLYLHNNNLATLPAGVFDGLTSLMRLRLAGNSGAPFAPAAVALPDNGTVPVAGGTVTLDGSGSDGGPWGANVTYSWALTDPSSGVTVMFDNAASATPAVTIPALAAGTGLTFTLTVTGRGSTHANSTGVATATDTARVTATDTVAPTVTSILRQTPASSPTNADALTWRVTFSEDVANVDAADFTVSNTSATLTAAAVQGSSLAYDVTAAGGNLGSLDATVTLAFANNQNIADLADNALTNTAPTGANENAFVVDNTAPTVTITGVPDMSSAAFTATITFTEPVTGFVLTDITLTNATASNFTGADGDTAFTALITPSANGAVTVDVAVDVAMDAAGNGNTAAARASSTYDNTAPTVASIARQDPTASPANADSLTWRVTFSEAVENVDTTDFTVTGTTATLTVAPVALVTGAYDVTAAGGNLAGLDATTVTLAFAANQNIADAANNALANTMPSGANDNTFVLDNTAPTVTITGVPDMSSAAFTATITFTEPVTGFVLTDITLTNATASNFTGADGETAFTALITPSANGAVTVDVAVDVAMDAAGNGNTAAVQASSTYDPNAGICGRTEAVQTAILGKISGVTACADVTSSHLAAITGTLSLGRMSITALAAGDFDGLTSLTTLFLHINSLATLPAGVFDALSALTTLFLNTNSLATLPSGVFDGLTSLTDLDLGGNDLSSLPAGVFDELTSLTDLELDRNDLSSLPAGVFDGLTSLTDLNLGGNDLSSLPAGVFDEMTALTGLNLNNNDLSTLPAGVFDELTSLTLLNLGGNDLSSLPAGVFDELTSLRWLDLENNELATLRAGVFADLTALGRLELSGNPGAPFSPTAVALPDDGTVSNDGGTVDLDGSGSDGGPWGANVTYSWALTNPSSGVTVTFDNSRLDSPAVTVPPLAGGTELTFTLTVTGRGSTHADSSGAALATDTARVTATDTIAPTVTSILRQTPASSPTNADALTWRVTFSEDVANVDAADFTVSNTSATLTAAAVQGSSLAYDVTAAGGNLGSLDATVTLAFANNQNIADLADNALTNTAPTGANENAFVVDNTAPTVTITGVPGMSSAAFTATITFTEPVTGFVLTDITLANATASNFTGADGETAFTALITPSANGAVTVDVAVDVAMDAAGNGNTAAVQASSLYDPNAGICGRTEAVQTAILAEISGVSACANVTSSHLAAITGRLSLRDRSISALAAGDFAGLTSLTTLFLNNNSLATLPAGVFDELTALTDLRLDNNDLSSLPAGVFDEMTALTGLFLNNNDLSSLPAGVFDELTALTQLWLYVNDLDTLRAGVFDELTALTGLELDRNDLSSLPAGVFDELTALTLLNLDGNDLSSLPAGVFDELTALTGLNLNNNDLSSLPAGVFDELTALTELFLAGNDLATLRAGVFDGLTSLRWLDLENNELATLRAGVFADLTALGRLELSGNPGAPFSPTAVALPDDGTVSNDGGTVDLDGSGSDGGPWGANVTYSWALTNPSSGVTVTFDNSRLDSPAVTVPPLAGGTELTFTLTVTGRSSTHADSSGAVLATDTARVTAGNEQFCARTAAVQTAILAKISGVSACANVTSSHLAAITGDLSLDRMSITALAAGDFAGLTALTDLRLNNNDLSSLPAGVFDALTSLTDLDLNSNGLATLPAGVFDALTSLTGLDLTGNTLATLPASVFARLTSLTAVTLGFNDLTALPAGVFDALTSLTFLGLENNDLATLPAGVFDVLTSLTWLRLPNNNLATLPAGVFDGMTSLLRLELSGNPGAPFAPTAVAVPDDGTVPVAGGTVTLDGSGSDGGPWGANVTYSWALTDPSSGVTVTFDDAASATPAVTIPALTAGTGLTFTLTVTGRGSTHADSTSVDPATDTARVTATATDTIAPTVTSILRQTPASSPTNADVLTWRVTFSEDVANVDGADFEVSGTSATLAAAAVSGSSAQYDVTASGGDLGSLDATVTLAFDADQDIADAAGNALANTTPTGANEASYVVDNTAPGVASILRQSPPSSPTHADILSWRVTFSEGVANVDTADFEVSGTSATLAAAAVSGSSRAYAVTASGGDLGSLDATVTLAFANNQNIADLAGNALATTTPAGANENAFVVDNTAPGVEISGVPETSTAAFTATITFSEGVNGFAVEDIAVGNGTASAFTGSDGDTEFTALITPAADGAVTVDVAADAAADAAGNGNTAAARASSTYDPNAGICGRTEAVRNAILAKISEVSDCVLVTDEHLAAITEMNVTVTALAAGDFAGLTALSSLDLDNNQMTTLPAGVFDGLTALRTLDLHGNALATLPAGVFDGLTALTDLFLFGNMLTTLPAGVFDALTALETLNLSGNNALATLPAGVFVRLTALETLYLHNNNLATLPAGVFDGLTSLMRLRLAGNSGAPFAPAAVALPDDGTVPVAGGTVTLDGSGSDGGPWGANVTYSWALTDPSSGVTVMFDNAASATPAVTIPALAAGTGLTFTLTVTGRGSTHANSTGVALATDTARVTATDTIAPTVTSILRQTPASSPTNADALTWRVTFSEDVANVDAADFTVSNTSATLTAAAVSGSSAQYDVTASGGDLGSLDATVTLAFANNQNIADLADNALTNTAPTGANENAFVVDNTAPTVTITGVPDMSSAAFTATITFTEPVTGFVLTDITLTNATASNFTGADGETAFTALITPSANGAVTVDVAVDVAMDAAGNGNTAAARASSTYDNTAPTVASIARQAPTASPANADSLTWRVTFSEAVENVDTTDFTVTGTTATLTVAPVTLVTGAYDVTAAGGNLGSLDATVTLAFDANQNIADAANNALANTMPSGANDNTFELDNTAPTVASIARQDPTASPANAASLTWRVTFSEEVANVDAPDFTITGTTATLTVTPVTNETGAYDVTATAGDLAGLDATVTLAFAQAQDIADPANNALTNTMPTGTNEASYVVDNTAPGVAISGVPDASTAPFTATITFTEGVAGFAVGDITVGNGTASAFTGADGDTEFTALITPTADGAVTVDVAADVAMDAAGNGNTAATRVSSTYTAPTTDTVAPTVSSVMRQSPTSSPTNADVLTWRVTFSEAVANVDAADFTVAGTTATLTATAVSGSSAQYDVTVSGGNLAGLDATVTLAFVAGQNIQDAAGNALANTTPTGANEASYVVDNIAPTVTISGVSPTSTAAFTVTITFSEGVNGFAVGDITVGNGTASAFTGSGGDTEFTALITPTADGAVTVDVAADVAMDAAGNGNTAAAQASSIYDNTAPTVASIMRQTPTSSPTNADVLTWRVTFSEAVANVDAADFAVSNTSATLTAAAVQGSSLAYDVTASGGNLGSLNATVTLSFVAGQNIADRAGNALTNTAPTGANESAFVVDNTAPTVTITGVSATSMAAFMATITFSEGVAGFAVEDIAVGNGAASAFTGSDGDTEFTALITPTADGEVTVDVAADVAMDTAGNGNTAAAQASSIYDNTAPGVASIMRQSPTSSPTNADVLTWRVTFSEAVANVDAADFTVAGTTATLTATAVSGSSAQYDVTVSGGNLAGLDATVTLAFVAGQNIQDAAGNALANTTPTGANEASYVVDNIAPTVTISGVSPTSTAAFTVTITFTEGVNGFAVEDIAVGNGAASAFTGSGGDTEFTALITPTADGAVTVDVAAGVATDAAGNGNTAATQASSIYDNTAPTVTITGVSATSMAAFMATFTFSEGVNGFTVEDITVGNGAASAFTGSGGDTEFTALITPTADGEVTVDVAADVATDAAGNGNAAATRVSSTYTAPPTDTVAPTVASIMRQSPTSSPTNADVLTWRVTFSEAVANVDAADFTVAGTTATLTATAVSGSSAQYDVTVSGGNLAGLNATVTLSFAASQNIQDAAGNALANTTPTGANEASYVVDNIAPTVTISGVPDASTAPFTVTITFTEGVNGFTVEDITVGNGAASAFTGSGGDTEFTALITPTADGAVTVDVAAGVAMDAAGNGNTAAAQASSIYDNTAPTVSSIMRQSPTSSPTNADVLTWRVTFSEAVANVDAADFTVAGTTATLTATAVQGSSAQYDMTASGGNLAGLNATVTLSFVAGQNIQDVAGNALANTTPTGANDNTFVVDNTAPTVEITDVPDASSAAFTAKITFSEGVNGFAVGEIAVGNGAASAFTGSGGDTEFTALITPTADGEVTVDVAAGVATDAAGNGNTAVAQASSTYTAPETTAPRVTSIAISPELPKVSEEHGPRYTKEALLALPDGAVHGPGATLTFTLTFDTAVTVTPGTNLTTKSTTNSPTRPELAIDLLGGKRLARYTGPVGTPTDTMVFTWTVSKGDYDPDGLHVLEIALNGATIRDSQDRDTAPETIPAARYKAHRVRGGLHAMWLVVSGSAREGDPFTVKVQRDGGFDELAHAIVRMTDSGVKKLSGDLSNLTPEELQELRDYAPRLRSFPFDEASRKAADPKFSVGTVTPPGDGEANDERTLTFELIATDVGDAEYSYWYDTREPVEVTVPVVDNGLATDAPSLSVGPADAFEVPDATLSFEVRLDPASGGEVTVDYATRDGTAVARADYVRTSGTLTFAAGETVKTVEVPVLQDAHDEGVETVWLVLSNPRGAVIARGENWGQIHNSGTIPKAWIARFGRTVAEQALEAVEGRMRGAPAPGVEIALAGVRIESQPEPGSEAEREARREAQRLADWLKGETDPEEAQRRFRAVTSRDLLTGSAFALTAETAGKDLVSLWGRGEVTRFDGREGKLTLDGEVVTGMLGADWSRGRWTAGLIVSHSSGEGGYSDGSGEASSASSGGKVEATLTSLFPWARHALSERLAAWGAAGYGAGELTVTPRKPGTDEDGAAIRADLDLRMAAVGLRGTMLDGGGDSLTLTGKTDAMMVQTVSGRGRGADGGNLEPARATVTRMRLGVEASRPVGLGGGATLTPSLEVGVRHDGGDAETGFGLDLGGGLALSDPKRGLAAELRGRGLLAHQSKGFRDLGFSGSLAWEGRPGSDRGAKLRLTQTVGGSSSGGADAFLSRGTLEGLAANDNGEGGNDELKSRRLELTAGYGIAMFGGRFTGTPELGLGLSDTGRDYRLGWRLELGSSGATSFEFGIEATRRESANDDAAEHAVGVRVAASW